MQVTCDCLTTVEITTPYPHAHLPGRFTCPACGYPVIVTDEGEARHEHRMAAPCVDVGTSRPHAVIVHNLEVREVPTPLPALNPVDKSGGWRKPEVPSCDLF